VLSITQLVAVAHSAPVPNLVLTCSDENAIGQEQNACDGIWAYQVPTNALIVDSGSLYIWRRFGDLIGADTVLVCTIPVEPGQYSSCRDASGARRTAFVRKDSIVAGGSVTVDKTGADYTDPVTAAQNAFAGDTWCVAPRWPAQPCVMAIGDGVFVLHETLRITEGLAVAGAGKGATMLVADNGVEIAVSSFGNVRISDLTIVNSQVGLTRATGFFAGGDYTRGGLAQLHDLAIHVSGAAQNVAIEKRLDLEILDSEITAAGQDTKGIVDGYQENGAFVTMERSHISAEVAFDEEYDGIRGVRIWVTDSHVSGHVSIDKENSRFEVLRSAIIGNVTADNDQVRVQISGSHIKGGVDMVGLAGHGLDITDTTVEGFIYADHSIGTFTFDGLQLLGELRLGAASAEIRRSYINSASTAAALFLGEEANVQLEQTFVQGAQALAVEANSRLSASSSVLAGPVSGAAGAVISCTDTYGADYELLTPSCQPQQP
jgi:hypothetical protein